MSGRSLLIPAILLVLTFAVGCFNAPDNPLPNEWGAVGTADVRAIRVLLDNGTGQELSVELAQGSEIRVPAEN